MRIQTSSVEIAAAPERVFAFMTDPSQIKRWQPDVVESRPLTENGFRVGARWRATVEEYGRRFDVETWVVALATNERIVVGMDAPTASGEIEYHFVGQGQGTSLSVTATLEIKGMMRILSFLVKGMVRRKMESRLKLLRDVVEAEQQRAGR